MEIRDADLVRLARAGDQAAFRLLVERHLPMVRARALRLCGDRDDADDIVQESFLQALVALGRLRDPDRFAGWLGGIVVNVHRALRRRDPLVLLADWPEQLHPVSPDGLPSAEDLDRADALRRAVASLPEGQRAAVAKFYYADLPPGQIAESAGAARNSLYKARRRLREHITAYRPDLIPVITRSTPMTTVRIAHAEPRPGRLPNGNVYIHHVLVVLADDAGHRALPVWLTAPDGNSLHLLLDRPPAGAEIAVVPEEFTGRLLNAAGVTVTAVDIDELGPEVTAAHVELQSPLGTQRVTARLADGLALAVTADAPVRVADAVMDRLAVPVQGDDLLGPFLDREPVSASPRIAAPLAGRRWRYEPRNLAFADGLEYWEVDGSSLRRASETRQPHYSAVIEGRSAILSSAVPQPEGFAVLRQTIYGDDYRGHTLVFRGELRTQDVDGQSGLHLQVIGEGVIHSRDPRANRDDRNVIITGTSDWTRHEITAEIADNAAIIRFGIFLTGRGRVELRNAELTRGG